MWRDYLAHYGVKGMKKGVRKDGYRSHEGPAASQKASNTPGQEKTDELLEKAKNVKDRLKVEDEKEKIEAKKKKTAGLLAKHGRVKFHTLLAK